MAARSSVFEQLESWPPPHTAAGWIRSDGRSDHHGDTARRFELASITKALFAYAVLIAVEETTLDLDQPAGPKGSTIRHLLAHTSGLGFDRRYPQANVRLAPVAHRRIYSNIGFDVLSDALTEASNMPANRYWHEAVAEPLGLHNTTLEGSAAFSATSTVEDLLRFSRELLAPTLVSPSTMAEAVSVQFPDLDGIVPGFGRQSPNPWGLGFEIRGRKSPHWTGKTNSPQTFGHFGARGTMLWVDPTRGMAMVSLSDLDFGPWAAKGWPELSDAAIAAQDDRIGPNTKIKK